MKKFSCVLMVLGALSAAMPASASELTIGSSQFPTRLHPSIDAHLVTSYIHGFTRRPISSYDADWQGTCLLCEELPSRENGLITNSPRPGGGEGVDVTFTLKEGLAFADGVPLTTKDILFTWQVGRHPRTGFANFELYAGDIVDIEIHDDRRFTLSFDRVMCSPEMLGDFQILPAHVEGTLFADDPDSYVERNLFDTDPTNPGLWFGPYRITQVDRGASIVLARNPHWAGEAPPFDRIILRAIQNTAALESALRAGQIDLQPSGLGLTLDQAVALESRVRGRYEISYRPGLVYEHIDLNLDNPILYDRRVRRALLHALDRESLNASLFEGRQPVAHASINPLDRYHFPDIPRYAFDPERARALLEEAGWQEGPDGVRRNDQGERLSLLIQTTAGDRLRELVQQVLQGMWADIGVEVVIRNQPARVFFGETTRRRAYPGMAMFAWISAPDNVPRTILHSSMIPTAENGWAGQNYTGFANPAMDRVIDALEVTCEPEPRRALWAELQRIYAEELPALPLYFRADPQITPVWLEGVEATGHLAPSSYWVERWRDNRP